MYSGSIIDTHFHVFRRADVPQYVLLSARVVQRDFSLDDYRDAMRKACVVAGVVVQAADVGTGMDELAYVERLAADPLVGRYVTYVPLDRPDSEAIIEQVAAHRLVTGVRYSQAVDPHGRISHPEAVLRSLHALARHGLRYELSIRPWQYAGLLELAAAAPDTTFVLGHLGKPRVGAGKQADWYDGIEKLAAHRNIVCKVSVALEGPDDPPYQSSIVRPLVRHVVASFGYERVLFGSNFPVSLISVTCERWLDMLDEFLADASVDDLDKLYRRNALRVYRLSHANPLQSRP